MASASYVSITQGGSCCICFWIMWSQYEMRCILHLCNLYKFVLVVLPSSFDAHTVHYNDVSHVVYAILSTHLTSESASGMCLLCWLGWSHTIAFMAYSTSAWQASNVVTIVACFSLLVTTMSGMHYRRHSRNQEDDWERRRLAAAKRLNKSVTGGRQIQPQRWTFNTTCWNGGSVSGVYNHCNMQWRAHMTASSMLLSMSGAPLPCRHRCLLAFLGSHNDIPVGLKRNIKFTS